jgi:hypothetical protein
MHSSFPVSTYHRVYDMNGISFLSSSYYTLIFLPVA